MKVCARALTITPTLTLHTHCACTQTAFNRLYDSFESYIAKLQDTEPNSANLQQGIDKFKAAKGLSARQSTGLDLRIESNIVQEYAARCVHD